MEDLDRQIVALLAEDGRMSFTDLGRATGVVDAEALGLPLTAFVSIKAVDPVAEDDAPQRLAHIAAIQSCYSVAGEEAYILKVRVASPQSLEALLTEIRAVAGVSTRTTVVLSTPFEDRPVQ